MNLKKLIKTLNKLECETSEIRDLLDYNDDEDNEQEIVAALYRIERLAEERRAAIENKDSK